MGWSDRSVLRSTSWTSRGPGLDSQHPHDDPQMPTTPVSGTPMSLSSFLEHRSHTWSIVIHTSKLLISIGKTFKNDFKSSMTKKMQHTLRDDDDEQRVLGRTHSDLTDYTEGWDGFTFSPWLWASGIAYYGCICCVCLKFYSKKLSIHIKRKNSNYSNLLVYHALHISKFYNFLFKKKI